MNISKTLVTASLILLASCASQPQVWTKEGASMNDFNKDNYDCMQQSQQYASSTYVNHYGGTARSGTVTNRGLYNACMGAQGYTLQDKNSVDQQDLTPPPLVESEKNSKEKIEAICAFKNPPCKF